MNCYFNEIMQVGENVLQKWMKSDNKCQSHENKSSAALLMKHFQKFECEKKIANKDLIKVSTRFANGLWVAKLKQTFKLDNLPWWNDVDEKKKMHWRKLYLEYWKPFKRGEYDIWFEYGTPIDSSLSKCVTFLTSSQKGSV